MADKGRPPLPKGSHGDISCAPATHSTKRKPRYRARARFREMNGRTVIVTRTGQTRAQAISRLREDLAKRQETVRSTSLSPSTRVTQLGEMWFASQREWADSTREKYGYAYAKHVVPALGALTLQEVSTGDVHRALEHTRDTDGPGAARAARKILAGMFEWAILQDALRANPARVRMRWAKHDKRAAPKALSREDADRLCDALRSDAAAVQQDLPDVVEWMLGTGARIGEVLAARRTVIDLEHPTWEINATMIRLVGRGAVLQERPKTAAGWRVLALPRQCVDIINRRATELHMSGDLDVVFGNPHHHGLRAPDLCSQQLREALDRHGFPGVTSHTFRKTVATWMDEAGQSARKIADQLGHSKPSMTLDVYMGRRVVSSEAAKILER